MKNDWSTMFNFCFHFPSIIGGNKLSIICCVEILAISDSVVFKSAVGFDSWTYTPNYIQLKWMSKLEIFVVYNLSNFRITYLSYFLLSKNIPISFVPLIVVSIRGISSINQRICVLHVVEWLSLGLATDLFIQLVFKNCFGMEIN